ncbi:uncharacterized protein LOC111262194 [Varroa jacobsoni]|uniref:uncharacterized protein LOC111262194 n=1 Tax=Varroa jacobsoni TaxID=62625 RepID=UPI000BF51FF5|nr:uncharacterized protein LOC111262194 [Varroa jacobsoni]
MADQGDLPRALRLAVSQIQPGSGPTEPMTEQDRAWLNEVLGEMAVPHSNNNDPESVNSAEVKAKTAAVKGITSVLSGLVDLIKDEQKPHILDAIKNELQHIADDGELLDRADDKDRRNAVAPISALLMTACADHSDPGSVLNDMIAPLCSILAELAQNSPECQQAALELIPKLITVVKSERDTAAKTKAVYALSAILRSNQSSAAASYLLPNPDDGEIENDASNEGAVDVLVKLICEPTEADPVRIKAAFLLSCLAEQRHDVRQLLSRRYETDMNLLREKNSNIQELVDQILQRIYTEEREAGKAPLPIGM